ncbi:MAG: beta-ketoacyl-ACP synthase III [Actinobacteria bacterium]|nr:beta-ketoacyl-ACP synthase III [Actinomycetota bacterium]
MMGSHVTGWGTCLPEGVLDNETLAVKVGVTPEWIVERTGISERRIVSDKETVSSLAAKASLDALSVAGLEPADIDTVIVATFTADYAIPAAAPLVASAIGATGAAAYDLNAGCAGFLYALTQADALVTSGSARRVLVVGSDVVSRYVDYTDARSCILFGDGAGAVVLEACEGPSRLGPFRLGSDGRDPELLWVRPETDLIEMQGREVYRRAVDAMTKSVREVLASSGLTVDDIDLLVAHQANARILAAVGARLGIDDAKVVTNIARVGNTSAASIPLALAEAERDGRIAQGDVVMLAAFGAGFAWGAGVVRWGAPVTESVARSGAGEVHV